MQSWRGRLNEYLENNWNSESAYNRKFVKVALFKFRIIFALIGTMKEICLITHFWQFCNMIVDSVFDMMKFYLLIQDLEAAQENVFYI